MVPCVLYAKWKACCLVEYHRIEANWSESTRKWHFRNADQNLDTLWAIAGRVGLIVTGESVAFPVVFALISILVNSRIPFCRINQKRPYLLIVKSCLKASSVVNSKASWESLRLKTRCSNVIFIYFGQLRYSEQLIRKSPSRSLI